MGVGTLSIFTSAATTNYINTVGIKKIQVVMVGTSMGSIIPSFNTTRFYTIRITGVYGANLYLGTSSVSATTSGDACNNVAYTTSYNLKHTTQPFVLQVGNEVYSGATGTLGGPTNLLNGILCRSHHWIHL